MPNEKDFVIENGVLIEYKGNDKEVVIPDEVKCIHNNAFEGKNIEKLTLGKNVEHIVTKTQEGFWGNYTQNFGYLNLSNLKEFKVSPENDSFLSVDGVLYDKKNSCLLAVPSRKKGALKILNGTINVKFNALEQWKGDIVVCPSSLNNYLYDAGLFAFDGAKRDIVLSRDADIQKIWNREQADLKEYGSLPTSDNLNIVFSDKQGYELSFKAIENSKTKHNELFEHYLEKSSYLRNKLENEDFPESVIEDEMEILYDDIMGSGIIKYNISLLDDSEIDKYYDNAFVSEHYDFKDGILTFKSAESFNACLYYQEEFPYNHILSIPNIEEVKKIVLPEDIEYIPVGCLKDYNSLEELIAPSVIGLGDYALCGCTSLKKVEFSPEINKENIGYRAFYYCTSLTERNIYKEGELIEPDLIDTKTEQEYEYDEKDYEEELTNNATAIGKLIESQTKDELIAGDEVLNEQEQLSVPVTPSGEDISHDDDNHDEF